MSDNRFSVIRDKQRHFFASRVTRPLSFRIEQLKKLKSLLQTHESSITDALKNSLCKAPMEGILNEIYLVITEIDHIVKHLKQWMHPKRASSPFPLLWPGRSTIHAEPYGTVLIISPWNYPFLLTLSPLIGAICAGNCAIVKPSEIATSTEQIILKLINDHFPPEYIAAVSAGPEETAILLEEQFDYICFTGGMQIGKMVMTAAAKHLTPITLELGGKSPCIVDQTANLKYAARRIAWAKTTNAGQVCIAPDYLYVHHSIKEELIKHIQNVLLEFYGHDPETSDSYGRIINQKHFARLEKLMQNGRIRSGGRLNPGTRYIAPTLIDGITWDDPIMQEEIFGPLLPILTYESLDDVINAIRQRPNPLALYLFTQNKMNESRIIECLSFGGGCINDCLLQIANYNLPFGGVGSSGMGYYHGKYSFDTFSHSKSIFTKTRPIEFKLEYPPYSTRKLWWLKKLLKF